MAKGDVIGVAAYPDEGPYVVRLQLDDGKGGETPGDPVVWVPDNPLDESLEGAWHAVKADDDVTDDERRQHRARPVPGERLEAQPPQVAVKLPQEVVNRGVAAKAALAVANGHPETAAAYLANRVEVGLIDPDTAEAIAGSLDVRLDREAMKQATKARDALIAAAATTEG